VIKAVVFDCFGVLASEGWIPFRDEHLAAEPAKLQQANELMRELATGQITDDTFLEAISHLANVTPEAVREQMNANVPDEEVFECIRTLKPRYKVAMLSNVGKNRLAEIFTPEQLELIDVFALSSETGYAKPDREAYQHVAKRLGVEPEECVFVDDQPRYLEGAQAAGMQTVLFQTAGLCIRELGTILNQPEA
jgi:putative hydrolase of the HAD superfamily